MWKPFSIVALSLIAAVLSGSQCAELCAFVAFEQQHANLPPCHQKPATCAHLELLAEQNFDVAMPLPALLPEAVAAPVYLATEFELVDPVRHSPSHRPPLLTGLRI
ncbi:MAG: hypothetical protein K2X03_17380 [Bryobacteraceae bacterium]|nr:hypothetical protein [Bryobacteraceae bacterium]